MGAPDDRVSGVLDSYVTALTAIAQRDSIACSERMAGMAAETEIACKSHDLQHPTCSHTEESPAARSLLISEEVEGLVPTRAR